MLWPERGENWPSGGHSPALTSVGLFDLIGEIQRRLAKIFPNLTRIVIAGHSAGGQFATRSEMASKVHGTLGVTTSHVVANPSSYAWPSAVRPLPPGDADPATADDALEGRRDEGLRTTN